MSVNSNHGVTLGQMQNTIVQNVVFTDFTTAVLQTQEFRRKDTIKNVASCLILSRDSRGGSQYLLDFDGLLVHASSSAGPVEPQVGGFGPFCGDRIKASTWRLLLLRVMVNGNPSFTSNDVIKSYQGVHYASENNVLCNPCKIYNKSISPK